MKLFKMLITLVLMYFSCYDSVSSSGTSGASFFTGKLANQIRDKNGNYIAVASRGNLFLTWTPGQDYWIPHNRGSSRYFLNFCIFRADLYFNL